MTEPLQPVPQDLDGDGVPDVPEDGDLSTNTPPVDGPGVDYS